MRLHAREKGNQVTKLTINIDEWCALSPGLISASDWSEWSKHKKQWPSELTPVPANLIKPMIRRRMSSLSKLALQSSLRLSQDKQIDYIIFSSRHGELTRTVKLIKEIMAGEEASPIAFSQSVHNTASGLFTILTQRATPVTSISALEGPFRSAFVEAFIYLQDNPKHKVLLVDFDEPLPAPYQSQEDEGNKQYQGYALSLILSHGHDFSISWQAKSAKTTPDYPLSFELIDFLLKQEDSSNAGSKISFPGKHHTYSLEKSK